MIQRYMQWGASDAAAQSQHDLRAAETGRLWVQQNRATVDSLDDRYGDRALTAIGFRHYYYNANSLNLAQMIVGKGSLPLVSVPRESLEDTVGAYREWLRTGSAASACLLLTASGEQHEFAPTVSGERMSAAAVAAGFVPIATWPLPDGRVVTEWQRQRYCPG